MDGLSRELPAYFTRAEGVSFKADRMADLAAKKVESGEDRIEDNLPHWAGAVNVVLLVQPSSACC